MLFYQLLQNPLFGLVFILILIMTITIHEFAHAATAEYLGDPTPRLAGRLTLNPLAHLDPIGTLMLLVAGFGWGKPVPFDPFNLKSPKRDSALISFAGPMSNFLIAILSSLILRVLPIFPAIFLQSFLTDILILFIRFNILLAIFNLLPVHPLDGFKVVAGILPKKYYNDWLELERYGMIFLILLIFPFFGNSPLFTVISPIINLIMSILLPHKTIGII